MSAGEVIRGGIAGVERTEYIRGVNFYRSLHYAHNVYPSRLVVPEESPRRSLVWSTLDGRKLPG